MKGRKPADAAPVIVIDLQTGMFDGAVEPPLHDASGLAARVRAVMDRRVHEITASLDTPAAVEHPAEALAEFGRVLLQAVMRPLGPAFMRMAMLGVSEMPEVGEAIYEAGVRASRKRLAAFLQLETTAGRLACPDPMQAADFFAGMVLGSRQTATLLGVDPGLDDARIDQIATEAATRFMRAYAL